AIACAYLPKSVSCRNEARRDVVRVDDNFYTLDAEVLGCNLARQRHGARSNSASAMARHGPVGQVGNSVSTEPEFAAAEQVAGNQVAHGKHKLTFFTSARPASDDFLRML